MKNRLTVSQRLRDLKKKPVYTGADSYPFWYRVNALPGSSRWRVYSLACLLQTVENMTLAELEHAEGRRK